MKFNKFKVIISLVFFGILDTAYLTWEHYSNSIPPCSTNIFIDCGKVLNSQYSVVFGIPLALVGLVNYLVLMGFVVLSIKAGKKIFRYLSLLQTLVGLVVSVYLMYLQFFVIGSICLYCTASALISFGLFYFIWTKFSGERKRLAAIKINVLYKHFIKNILFLIDPEAVHNNMLVAGEFAGKSNLIKKTAEIFLKSKNTRLSQKIYGIGFGNPI
ncbi:hypothetical protein A2969_01820, partial [Candidatus Woesebacteria bacterium RIFCSPLOWO2_01_FULL_42_67]